MTSFRPFDPISLLETAYLDTPTQQDWAGRVGSALHSIMDGENKGIATYFVRPDLEMEDFRTHGGGADPKEMERVTRAAPARALEEQIKAIMDSGMLGLSSVVEQFGPLSEAYKAKFPVPFEDSVALVVPSGEGSSWVVGNLVSEVAQFSAQERELWARLAIHLGAALRLVGRELKPDASDVDAVFDASNDFNLVHATSAASSGDVQQELMTAAKRVDHARTQAGRRDPEEALTLWTGLFSGQWSLVEHIESDGKRLMLARRNDPNAPVPGDLSRRQRQVAFYAALGWTNELIAYALGLSASTVATHLSEALGKFGLDSRQALVAMAVRMMAATKDATGG